MNEIFAYTHIHNLALKIQNYHKKRQETKENALRAGPGEIRVKWWEIGIKKRFKGREVFG